MTKELEANQGPELGRRLIGKALLLLAGGGESGIPIPAANYTSRSMSSGFSEAHCNETSSK